MGPWFDKASETFQVRFCSLPRLYNMILKKRLTGFFKATPAKKVTYFNKNYSVLRENSLRISFTFT